MSGEEESFLNRWSRRKQDAAKEVVETDIEATKDTPSAEAAAAADSPEEEFDVSTLPPIESITAGTDIRAFLSKGVPAALTQAALRRAWSADPAIRDYIGLSEYSWDFNSPGIQGFGPLDPSLNIEDMVADVFGKVKQAVAETETLIEQTDSSAQQAQTVAAPSPPNSVELRSENIAPEPNSEISADNAETEVGDKTAQSTAAAQPLDDDIAELPLQPRRHGSALPS